MTDYRCGQCGLQALIPPGAAAQGRSCRYCGGAVVPVLSPVVSRRAPARSYAWLLWVALGVGGILALGLAVPRFLAWGILGPREAQALTASRRWVSVSQLATPIQARLVAVQRGRRVSFSMQLADASGKRLRAVRLAGGRRPDVPAVSVVDGDGAVVHTGRMRYG